MKICIIAPAVLPLLGNNQFYGGIEYVVSLVADQLAKKGHDVYLFASGDSKTKANLVPIVPKALTQNASFEDKREANKNAYEMAIEKSPDIIWDNTAAIHAQEVKKIKSLYHFEAEISLNTKELIDTGNIPVVQAIHGPAKHHLPNIVKKITDYGHYIVNISYNQARKFEPFIKPGQGLGVIYNAIDLDFFKLKEEKENYLLWVGRYGLEKGAHIALHVAHKLNIPIRMLGKLVEKHEHEYFNKFIKDYLRSEDKIYNMVDANERVSLYQNAKYTLMTTLWSEPFGLVAIESMAAGTPVVSPAYGSLTEVVNGSGILVPVNNLGLSEEETEHTRSQQRYANRVANYVKTSKTVSPKLIRDRAEKLFSIKNTTDNYEEAFEEVIKKKSGKNP